MEMKSQQTSRKTGGVLSARIGLGNQPVVTQLNRTISRTIQETYSQENRFHELRSAIRSYERNFGKMATLPNIGGPFQSIKREAFDDGWKVQLHEGSSTSSLEYQYSGKLHAYSYQVNAYPSVDLLSDFALWSYGNKARSIIEPTNPATSSGQGIGELRSPQGVPGIPGVDLLKERVRILRSVGGNYLNYEFGWKPVERDLRAAAQATKDAITILRQYEANRGNALRRRYSFPRIQTESTTVLGTDVVLQPDIRIGGFFDKSGGTLSRTDTKQTDIWFSGAFTYYVTPGISSSKLAAYEAAANKLLGTRLTPSLVWELAPWSWLTDWFVDMGALIGNIQSAVLDGSVMWYGYVMCRQRAGSLYTNTGIRLNKQPAMTVQAYYRTETKQRVRASPFGFGLSPNAFSMKQWSILAALGISKV
jgi:hypothetical protein